MEELKISIYVIMCCFIVFGFIAYSFILGEIKEARDELQNDLQKHQDWLFEQLCRIAPGKVLLPEQEESAEVGAVVVNPKDNPMNEFNGKKTDWFV